MVRYLAASVMLIYGFAKLNGSQFTVLHSELDKPMGKVSGFWLAWYYFGFSPYYGAFIAFSQITGALLLTFRRTTLLGASSLALILFNIILIDICYQIDLGATVLAVLVFSSMIWLISKKWKRLQAVLWSPAYDRQFGNKVEWRVWCIRLTMLGAAFWLTYWTANYNNRAPTPLDGIWDVVRVAPQSLDERLPKTIFFEHNRAFISVFKTANGLYETHHFELDKNTKQIRFWEQQSKQNLLFTATYSLAGSELKIIGALDDTSHVEMQLHKRSSV